MCVAAAIAGAAVVGAGASIYSANKAAGAQESAANLASSTQLGMYNQSRADQAPWRQAGGRALDALSQWYGLGGLGGATVPATGVTAGGYAGGAPAVGDTQTPGISPFGVPLTPMRAGGYGRGQQMTPGMTAGGQPTTGPAPRPGIGQQPIDYNKILSNLPGYQFQLSQGENAVQSNLAARGLLQSGAAGKALTQYGQGVASDYATQYINGLQSLAGLGQTSAANTGAWGANAANQLGGNMLYGGNAQASGYVGQANAINSGLSGLAGVYGQYRQQQ